MVRWPKFTCEDIYHIIDVVHKLDVDDYKHNNDIDEFCEKLKKRIETYSKYCPYPRCKNCNGCITENDERFIVCEKCISFKEKQKVYALVEMAQIP